ncbi:hypothetical protein G7046_g6484 [Stylonectria norvegica]|nr:hypothetical protein G7046_g6484 [Stylonectria norvegica]
MKSLYCRLSEDEIRLVKLYPGAWDDPLKAELFPANKSVRYVALSYAWGNPRKLRDITVDDYLQKITVNLDLALRTLRSAHRPTTLWVDALCINQEDPDDKSQQVSLMYHIFTWAAEVRAYVGHPIERSRPDYESQLRKLGSSNPVDYSVEDLVAWETTHAAFSQLAVSDPARFSPSQRCLCVFGLLRALSSPELASRLEEMELFSKPKSVKSVGRDKRLRYLFEWLRVFAVAPWWDRMWITQEVGVARELLITYGNATMSFHTLSRFSTDFPSGSFRNLQLGKENTKVLDLIVTKVKAITELRSLQQHTSLESMTRDVNYFQQSLSSPLLWLLRTFRHRKSAEPRDKIFALSQLLGNLHADPDHGFKTDYNTSVTRLFCQITLAIMQETGLFWITSIDLAAKSRNNLPSWVPNWADEFSSPDPQSIAWKVRLCHNASDMDFTIEKPDQSIQKMKPSIYYCQMAEDKASRSWRRLKGQILNKRATFKPVSTLPRQDIQITSYCLGRSDDSYRRVTYENCEQEIPGLVDFTICLSVPAQFCVYVEHVSEPVAPDLSNLVQILNLLRESKIEDYPGGWYPELSKDTLSSFGRALCFGAYMQPDRTVRQLQSYDDNCLALLTFCLLFGARADGGVVTGNRKEIWGQLNRDHFTSQVMAECSVCYERWQDEPCETCLLEVNNKQIPTLSETRKDPNVTQLYQTALQTAPGSCILLTRDGKLGLGPPQTRRGDLVCILSGGLCPYVLRSEKRQVFLAEKEKFCPTHRLIGDCFIDLLPKWDPDSVKNVVLV